MNSLFRPFRRIPVTCLSLLGALSVSHSAVGNMITNGSFEDPTVPAGTFLSFTQGSWIGPVNSGWEVTAVPLPYGAPAVIPSTYVGGGVDWHLPSDGNQFLYLGNSTAAGTTIAQTVSLAAGTPYELSFDLADFRNGGQIWAGHGPGEVLVDIIDGGANSVVGGPRHFTTAAFAAFSPYDLTFTPSLAGDYRVTFTSIDLRPANLDNIRLDVAGVPDAGPSSVLLLGGLAGLPIVRRVARARRG